MKNLGKEAFQERIDHAENSFLFEIRMLEKEYNLSDPEDKTRFHREIARKLCDFSEEVERENYIEAVAEKYHIGFENLRKLVGSIAAQTGLANPWNGPNRESIKNHPGGKQQKDPEASAYLAGGGTAVI